MADQQPLLSVVVPTRGRPCQLTAHLVSMTRLRYSPERYELIVVDDGGPESLAEIVGSFRESLPLILMRQDHGGPGSARNAGAARARGRYLVFTADDCQPAADWLAALERRLLAHPGTMIGGDVANALPDDLCATTNALLIDYLYRCHDRDASNAPFFTPNNLAVPVDLFRRLGGFDASMGATGEDREFCDRWLASGLPMISAPEAVVQHVHPLTLRAFWQQHVSYGRGSRRFYSRRARRGDKPHPARWTPEPLAFYWDLVCYPLSRFPGRRGRLHAGMMVLAQLANVVGFSLEGFRPGEKGFLARSRTGPPGG